MIVKIGKWVLRSACKQAASLPSNIVMAVNASPLQFKNGARPAVRMVETLETSCPPRGRARIWLA